MQNEIFLNSEIAFDLPTLLDTRLLIQANSGGGKSWLIRRILEQSNGKMQQIIIDLEGEFSTLREQYDYILVGKGGDTYVPPEAAGLLAQKLLENNVSAILDLYEFSPQERKHFVRLFLDAMVSAPRELWHPCLVVIDEAHIFCPEKGQSEAAEAVIDLATRGRKRGFCVVLATQRLSKLHKDAAAECNNKLIGRTGLDVDMKRASEELGFASKAQYLSLRKLDAGEFFAYGPAISQEVIEVRIGPVQTSHPKAGSRILAIGPTPPTQKIRHILSKLEDLPQEAEKEAQTIEELKKQIATLKKEFTHKKINETKSSLQDVNEAVNAALQKQREVYDRQKEYIKVSVIEMQSKLQEVRNIIETLIEMEHASMNDEKIKEKPELQSTRVPKPEGIATVNDYSLLPKGAERILQVLISRYPMKFNHSQVGTLAHLSPGGGSYNRYLSLLQNQQLIAKDGSLFFATEQGRIKYGSPNMQKDDSPSLIELWRKNLPQGAKRMLDVLVKIYPENTTKEELASHTALAHNGGTFGKYLHLLESNGLIERNGGNIKASATLFLDNH